MKHLTLMLVERFVPTICGNKRMVKYAPTIRSRIIIGRLGMKKCGRQNHILAQKIT
jgi:hypothetical protein